MDVPTGIVATERVEVAPGDGWFSRAVAPRHDDAPAQIAFTSGTTGTPKAILLSHRTSGDVTDRLIDIMALDRSIREYVGVPVTFSFGFGCIRAIAAAGGAAFLPERGFRVDELAAMLESGQINALSAVPTPLRVALAQAARRGRPGPAAPGDATTAAHLERAGNWTLTRAAVQNRVDLAQYQVYQ
ncbi:AMP-binding enzyme [Sphingomonas gellani]|uniref:AMP-binding enzyme n=1 Tax=Sphingomonas gellani TaxID=1166340 RepID=A0A1H8HX00_9SPHN|nr:AMP-binding protein [Sphingomonas gellani]SEN60719.1 AMP-binding enzyme [Sphingomonas gellani]